MLSSGVLLASFIPSKGVKKTQDLALLNLIFLAHSCSKTQAWFLINTYTKSHDWTSKLHDGTGEEFPDYFEGCFRSKGCRIPANTSGIMRWGEMAAQCWVRDRVGQRGPELSSCSLSTRALLELGKMPLCRAPGRHGSRSFDLADHGWGATTCSTIVCAERSAFC